jgi:hypothetical protein
MLLFQITIFNQRPRVSNPVDIDDLVNAASANKRVVTLTRAGSKFLIDLVPPNAMADYGKRLGLGALSVVSGIPGLGGLRRPGAQQDPDHSNFHFVVKAPNEGFETEYTVFNSQSRALQSALLGLARLSQMGVDFVCSPQGFKALSAETGAPLGEIKFDVKKFKAYCNKDEFQKNPELTVKYGKDYDRFRRDTLNELIPAIRAGASEIEGRTTGGTGGNTQPQQTGSAPTATVKNDVKVLKISPTGQGGNEVTLNADRFPYIQALVTDLGNAAKPVSEGGYGVEYSAEVREGVATVSIKANTGFQVEKIGELKLDSKRLFGGDDKLDKEAYVLELRRNLKNILSKLPKP